LASGSNTAAEHSAHHFKVKGSSQPLLLTNEDKGHKNFWQGSYSKGTSSYKEISLRGL
jgi:hypothetical protein